MAESLGADAGPKERLNPNHVRVLAASFTHLDQQLARVEAAIQAQPSPLTRDQDDFAAEQRPVVIDHVEQIRDRLASAMRSLELSVPQRIPLSRTLHVALTAAQISLEELAPNRLAGYGLLGPEVSDRVATVLADLDRAIQRLIVFLGRPSGRDLADRIARVSASSVRADTVLLAALARAITRHGLVELRPALAALLDLIENRTFEVAIFGRVSSGKSSLINKLVGVEILPVGATPVTAVPTRVQWGMTPSAFVKLASNGEKRIDLDQLVDYITEAHNPGNRRGVVRALVEVASTRLAGRIALVDTPGVGALASAAAREVIGYLPRCDLGIIVIDASSAPSREDVDLLRRMEESGIAAQVVISKIDLVPQDERARVRAYFAHELEQALGHVVPVDAVSVRGTDAELVAAWFDERIEPLRARTDDAVAASAARKLGALHASAVAILRATTDRSRGPSVDDEREIERLALAAEGELRRTATRTEALIARSTGSVERVLHTAAHQIHSSKLTTGDIVKGAVAEEIDAIRHGVELEIVAMRARLHQFLIQLAGIVPSASVEIELRVDLISQPSLDLPPVEVDTSGSRWPGAERRLFVRLDTTLGDSLRTAFEDFTRRLRAWAVAVIASVGEQVATYVEPCRARARTQPPRSADVDEDLAALERL